LRRVESSNEGLTRATEQSWLCNKGKREIIAPPRPSDPSKQELFGNHIALVYSTLTDSRNATRGGRMASSYQYSFEQSVDERDTIYQVLSFVMKR
jgi:hypothetical protein